MSSPPPKGIGDFTPSPGLPSSPSTRGQAIMSQSASGRHLRRVSAGNRQGVSPPMNTSSSFSKSPRLSLGGRSSSAASPNLMDRTPPSNDGRRRTNTEPAAPSLSNRLSPTDLPAMRPSSAYVESTSFQNLGLSRAPSSQRARPSKGAESGYQERPKSRKCLYFLHGSSNRNCNSSRTWVTGFIQTCQACF